MPQSPPEANFAEGDIRNSVVRLGRIYSNSRSVFGAVNLENAGGLPPRSEKVHKGSGRTSASATKSIAVPVPS
jgi:hypothetical protein